MTKLLLDTHTFLWFMEGARQLSSLAKNRISNSTAIYLSIISFWEISIKLNIGKLDLKFKLQDYSNEWKKSGGNILPLSEIHTFSYLNLPLYHRDPFDRMLIAQAKTENLTIITKDKNFSKYDVDILW